MKQEFIEQMRQHLYDNRWCKSDFEKYDIASKLIAGILASTTASSRMKDKARDVKDLLVAKRKEQSVEKDS